MDRRALLARAAAAFDRRDLAAAEHDCRTVLAMTPGDADATHLFGLVRRRAGDDVAAEPLLRASIAAAPGRAEFRINFGNLLRSTGRANEAQAQYRVALELEPGSRSARLALARLLNDIGAADQARQEAQILVSLNPRDAEAWNVLGTAQRTMGDLEQAESSYCRAVTLRPQYAVARHNLGALLGQLQKAEESLFELQKAAELGVSGRELQFNRARALLELGRLDDAETALIEALRAAPEDLDSHVLLAKLRFMRGDMDFLRELRAASQRSGRPQLCLALGDLLRRSGCLVEAETELRAFVAARGWTPQAGSSLAVLLQEQGRLAEAQAEARAALDVRPDDPDIAENLIAVLLQMGEHEESWPLIQQQRQHLPLDQRWLAYEATAARLAGSPRYQELYDYERFVRQYELAPGSGWSSTEALHAELIPKLVTRHRFARHPLDQSLRFGSQTSRSLLTDPDPVIRDIVRAFDSPIAQYREALGQDAAHPYLARNSGRCRLTGCWSVRLMRGGYHVNHVHPQGWVSSAYYVELPAETAGTELKSGWIKFGEPRMPVPGAGPGCFVQPRVGQLVLFPSYMWHGTTPIRTDEPRLTIAFDAVTVAG